MCTVKFPDPAHKSGSEQGDRKSMAEQSDREPVVLALTGKGGVGKTSLSAMFIRILLERYPTKKILAIDADPAVGLATALGVDVKTTVDDIRNAFIHNAESGEKMAVVEMLGEAKYRMFDALVEEENLSFLAIGRPESAGCYCTVNTYLKEIINLLASNFDYIVIDGEAGIEQVNRRVMEKITHLVLVSDASRKGLDVVSTIHEVAGKVIHFEKAGLIINRMPDLSMREYLDPGELEIAACIPDDREMTMSDMLGKTVFEIPEEAAIYRGAEEAMQNLGIIEK